MMSNRFDEILDDCLTSVMLHGESVEACLQRYPDHAAALREHLEVARIAQAAYTPRASAKDRARAALLAAMQEVPAVAQVPSPVAQKPTPPPSRTAPLSPWGRWKTHRLARQRFEEALDSCITALVLQGASVEACLQAYPDLAAELAPHLAVAARAQQAYTFTPRPEAKAGARARLHQALREEVAKEGATPLSHFGRGLGRGPWPAGMRWGTSLAAVLLSALVGGGTVAASNDALPGDPLYPVKTGIERATLAVQVSPEARAALHLEFATRRAEELSQVLPRGQTATLQPVLDDLNAHLDEAARIAATVRDPNAQAQLKSRAAGSAAQALSGLQSAVNRSSGPARDAAATALATSGDAFASALEEISSSPAPPQPLVGEGTVVLRVANPVPSDLDRVLIRVGAIEARLATGEWVRLATDPQVFDLRPAQTAQWLLGDFRVPAGTYTQVRLAILDVTAWSGGQEREVEIPAGGLRMVRPFTVARGEPTVVLLNFEGRSAITPKAGGNLELRPAVQIQVDEPASREREKEKPRGQEAPTAVPQPVRTAIEGVLEAVSREAVQVKGKTIALGSSTRIEGVPAVGRLAKIEAEVQVDGRLRAISVEVREQREEPGPRERGNNDNRGTVPDTERETPQRTATPTPSENRRDDAADREERQREETRQQQERERQERERQEQQDRERQRQQQTPTRTPTPSPAVVRLEGTINRIGPTEWVVNGRTIVISTSTRIEGDPAVGRTARVNGLLQQDGRTIATTIRVEAPREEDAERPRARQTPAPTRTPEPERNRNQRGQGQGR